VARGWESKSIESQQDDAARSPASGPVRTPEEVARASRRAGLELALAQTQAEIGASCRPAHREMLHLRLAAIKEQLAAQPL
jgi:hypothetical protein